MLILAGLVVLAAVVKVFQSRLPARLYRAVVAGAIVLPLLATVYAIWLLWESWIGWSELALLVGLYAATGLGITLGFHRLLTHRSFETGPVVRGIFLALGSMANQGRCIDWAAHHLKHHAHSDQEGDPHSPLEGLFHAHVGWLVRAKAPERERYCKPLLADPVVRFIDRSTVLWVLLGLLIPYLAAGWLGLLWGGFVRIAFTSHVTFAVNSIAHRFGSQPFETGDESRNNWLVAMLAFGEGWHNNHHAFPSMAYHGMRPRQFDLTGLVIRTLILLRLGANAKLPASKSIERRRRATATA